MKNITVSVDDDTYRAARIKAAERGRSVSAMVREYLGQLASEQSVEAQLHARELILRDRIKGFGGAERLSRDAVHGRRE